SVGHQLRGAEARTCRSAGGLATEVTWLISARNDSRFLPAEGGNGRPSARPVASLGRARRLIVGHPISDQRETSGSAARSPRIPIIARQPCGLTKTRSWRPTGGSAGLQGKVTNALRDIGGLRPATALLTERISS